MCGRFLNIIYTFLTTLCGFSVILLPLAFTNWYYMQLSVCIDSIIFFTHTHHLSFSLMDQSLSSGDCWSEGAGGLWGGTDEPHRDQLCLPDWRVLGWRGRGKWLGQLAETFWLRSPLMYGLKSFVMTFCWLHQLIINSELFVIQHCIG